MAKKKKQNLGAVDHGRGVVKDSHMAALVTSKVFRNRVVEDKTKYKRKAKHSKGWGASAKPTFAFA